MPLTPVVATKSGSGESLPPVSNSNGLNLASALASLLGLPFASNLLPAPALSSPLSSSSSSVGSTAVTSNQYHPFTTNRIHDSNIMSPSNLTHHQLSARDPTVLVQPRKGSETRENNYRQQAVLSNHIASDNNLAGSNPHVFSFNFAPQTQVCSDVSSDTGSVQSPFPGVNQPTSSAVVTIDNNTVTGITGSDAYYNNSFRRFSVDSGDFDVCDPASNSSERDRKQREFIPDSKKDDKYWERRRKNNEAAKRSREKRRQNDVLMEQHINVLNAQNQKIRRDLLELKLRFGVPLDDADLQLQEGLSTTGANYMTPVEACKVYCNGQSDIKTNISFINDQDVLVTQSPSQCDAHSQEDQFASPSSLRNLPKLDEVIIKDDPRVFSPFTSLNGTTMDSTANVNYLGTTTVTIGSNTVLLDRLSPPISSTTSFYSSHPSISSHNTAGLESYNQLPITATNNINGALPSLDNGPISNVSTNPLDTNDLIALRRIFSTLIMNKEAKPGVEPSSNVTSDKSSVDRQELFCHTSPLHPLALLPTESDPPHNQMITTMLPDSMTSNSRVSLSDTSAANWLFRQAALLITNNQHLSTSCASSPHSIETVGAGHEQVPPPLGANIAASGSLKAGTAPVMQLLNRLPPVMLTVPSPSPPSVRPDAASAGTIEMTVDSPLDLRLCMSMVESAATTAMPIVTASATTKSTVTVRKPGMRDRMDMKILDKRYQDRRRRNNEAVRRCRENKRARILGRAEVTDRLHTENNTLRSELTDLSTEVKALRKLLSSDNFSNDDRTDLLKTLHMATNPMLTAAAAEEGLPVSKREEMLSNNEPARTNIEFTKQPVSSEVIDSPFTTSPPESLEHQTQGSATLSTIHSSCSDMDGDEECEAEMRKVSEHDETEDYCCSDAIMPCLDQEHHSNGMQSEERVGDKFVMERKTNGVHHRHHHHHARSSKCRRKLLKRNSYHTFSSRNPTGSTQAWSDCSQPSSKTTQLLNTCDYLSARSQKDAISS